MNPEKTSKEAIMQVCRRIVSEKGLQALNMRSVAKECHIALGTLYNYYSDKDDLLIATVESVWKDIFHMNQGCEAIVSFPEYVNHLFQCIQKGAGEYPNFFTSHSIGIANLGKDKAKGMMERCFVHMKSAMLTVLNSDSGVDSNVFSEAFTKTDFIDFVFDNMLLQLAHGREDSKILVEIINRVVY